MAKVRYIGPIRGRVTLFALEMDLEDLVQVGTLERNAWRRSAEEGNRLASLLQERLDAALGNLAATGEVK